jgi:hypothetical protein
MNSDDRYRPGCFATVTQRFTEQPKVDVVYGDYTWMDEKGCVKKIRREIEFSRFILSYHRVLYIATVSTFFRRRLFEEGNWLDTSLQYAMDYDLFLRLAEKGYRFDHIRSILADFRFHSQSKTSAHSGRQFAEHDALAMMHSPILRGIRGAFNQKVTLGVLRSIAAGLRYSQKLLRGYYFEKLPASQLSASPLLHQ